MYQGSKKIRIFYSGVICLFVAAIFFPSNAFARIEFELVSAKTNKVLQPITCYFDEFIHIREYGNALNIKASLSDKTSMSKVAKITFRLFDAHGGDYDYTHTENHAPFAAYGDDNGNFNSWNLVPDRSYALSATAYDSAGNYLDSSNSECLSLIPKENNYAWIDFHLINANSNQFMRELNWGHTTNYVPNSQPINISAVIPDSSIRKNIKLVKFFLDGQAIKDEKKSPYTIAGDDNGNYYAWAVPSSGSHTLRAVGYDANNKPIAERTLRIYIDG